MGTLVLALFIAQCTAQQSVDRDASESPQQSIQLESDWAKIIAYIAGEKAAYEEVQSLEEAVGVLQRRLTERELAEFVPLLDARRVKAAIRKAVDWKNMQSSATIWIAENWPSERRGVDDETLQRAKRYLKYANPLYQQILKKDEWPRGAYFMIPSGEQKASGHYDLFVTLHVDTEGDLECGDERGSSAEYSISILEVSYGKL